YKFASVPTLPLGVAECPDIGSHERTEPAVTLGRDSLAISAENFDYQRLSSNDSVRTKPFLSGLSRQVTWLMTTDDTVVFAGRDNRRESSILSLTNANATLSGKPTVDNTFRIGEKFV